MRLCDPYSFHCPCNDKVRDFLAGSRGQPGDPASAYTFLPPISHRPIIEYIGKRHCPYSSIGALNLPTITMSSKAQMLLGVMPESEQRRYKASPRLSRRTSNTLETVLENRRDAALRSTSPHPLEPWIDHPMNSNNSKILHDTHSMISSSDRPVLSPRGSNSTIRSFAPPTVPTYLPRHMGSSFIPHVAYGRRTEAGPPQFLSPSSPPPLPSSPHAEKHGLRKAISRISLRSNKSRSRVSEAQRPESTTFLVSGPNLQREPKTAALKLSPTRQDVEEARLRPKTSGFVTGTGPRHDMAQQSASRLARSRRELAGRSKEWYDALDTSDEDVIGDTLSPMETASLGRVTRRKEALARPLKDLETHASPHTRIKRDSSAPQPPKARTPASSTTKDSQVMGLPKVSVVCEQTMFDLTDSDSDNDGPAARLGSDSIGATAMHRRQRSSKSSGILKSARSLPANFQHQRQSSSKSVRMEVTSLQDGTGKDKSFLDKLSLTRLEDTLTESVPSLIGSGSSRPTSYFSTQPNSPSLRQSSADAKPFAPITIADEERWSGLEQAPSQRRSDANIAMVPDVGSEASARRIVASLSPEEAILLAKLRRNRIDTSVNQPASTSESDTQAEEPDSSEAEFRKDSLDDTSQQPDESLFPTSDSADFFHPLARLAAEDIARLTRRDSKLRAALSPPPRDPRRTKVVSQLLSPSSNRLSVLSESDDTLMEFPTPPSSARTSAALFSSKPQTVLSSPHATRITSAPLARGNVLDAWQTMGGRSGNRSTKCSA